MISDLVNEKTLTNLSASINVILYTILQNLSLSDLHPTRMTLQLADHSIWHPRGITANVLVKVDKFIFPLDFDVLDVDGNIEVPLALDRSFLTTSHALIDVCNGKTALRIGDEEVAFILLDAMKHSYDFDDSSFYLDVTDYVANDCLQDLVCNNPIEESLNDPLEDEAPSLDTNS